MDSGHVTVLGSLAGAGEGNNGGVNDIEFLDKNHLLVSGFGGLQLFDISKNTSKILSTKTRGGMTISPDRRFVFIGQCEDVQKGLWHLVRIDLRSNVQTFLTSHVEESWAAVLDRTGKMITSATFDGLVRVGPVTGEEPHILFGHEGIIDSIAFSPDSRWIATAGRDLKIRLLPVPDLSKPAPHTLPYDQFMTKLKSFTNLRVVADQSSPTGWKLEIGPFTGWHYVPSW